MNSQFWEKKSQNWDIISEFLCQKQSFIKISLSQKQTNDYLLKQNIKYNSCYATPLKKIASFVAALILFNKVKPFSVINWISITFLLTEVVGILKRPNPLVSSLQTGVALPRPDSIGSGSSTSTAGSHSSSSSGRGSMSPSVFQGKYGSKHSYLLENE